VVVVIGRSYVIHNLFSYSLLREICDRRSGLVYVLERPITYLLKHSNSIVVQREVGVDVDTFEEGIEEALLLSPEIIYVSDMMIKDALRSVRKLFDVPILTLLSITASNVQALRRTFEIFLREESGDVIKLINKVVELSYDREGKIAFRTADMEV